MPVEVARNVYEVATLLKRRYNDFPHYNKSNPFDELLFIVCSTKTSETGYRETYRSLRKRFPRNELFVNAETREIARAIQKGGLANKKARALSAIVRTLVDRFGKPTLMPLRGLTDYDCESFLRGLPGVGKKVARCVMLYSLDRQVFPVDEHCWRISKRLGWIRKTRRNRSGSPRDEDRLQEKIPPPVRFSLHVNMISLGREICLSRAPRCGSCTIEHLCPKLGIKSG
ncbi:MAG: hypothetical protein IH977_04050 [Nitrospinae bacterium]|nr:hypothetical protein [Nitrospinota bacterium]